MKLEVIFSSFNALFVWVKEDICLRVLNVSCISSFLLLRLIFSKSHYNAVSFSKKKNFIIITEITVNKNSRWKKKNCSWKVKGGLNNESLSDACVTDSRITFFSSLSTSLLLSSYYLYERSEELTWLNIRIYERLESR